MPYGEQERNWWSIAIFEALGTLLLVYFSITGDHQAIAISLAFFTCYLLFAPISRGHFNPAVTMGVWLGEIADPPADGQKERQWGKEIRDFFLRLGAQVLGGVAGVFLAYVCLARHRMDGTYQVAQVFITKLCPKDPAQPDNCEREGDQQLQMIGTQSFLAFVFVLAFIVIRKKGIRPSEDEIVQAVAIALVFFGLTHVGSQSGASFNPVLSGSMLLFEYIASPTSVHGITTYLAAYLIGPFIGAVISALFAICISCFNLAQEEDDDKTAKANQDTAVQKEIKSKKEENQAADKDGEAKQGLTAGGDNEADGTKDDKQS